MPCYSPLITNATGTSIMLLIAELPWSAGENLQFFREAIAELSRSALPDEILVSTLSA